MGEAEPSNLEEAIGRCAAVAFRIEAEAAEDTTNPFTTQVSNATVASAFPKPQWQENTETCGVCNEKLGKSNLRRRHHCRACGKCVCSGCSPSLIQLDGKNADTQRVCTPCVQN